MIIPATALADFAFCPRLYYIKHILGIKKISRRAYEGIKTHREAGTEEIYVEVEINGVKVRGRADFVRKNKIVELKMSTPHFWLSHVAQASIYALGLEKREIEIEYRNLGLKIMGKPFKIDETVERLRRAHAEMRFEKNPMHCSLCMYRKICRGLK